MEKELSIPKGITRFHKDFLVEILKNSGRMALNIWKKPNMPLVGFALMPDYIKLDNYDKTNEIYYISLTEKGRKLANEIYWEKIE